MSNLSGTTLHKLSDAELVALSRDGDASAYGVLYERHQPAAHRAAMRAADATLANDVVAEAFTRVFDLLQRGGGPDVAFRPYLLAAVRNAFVSHVRTDANMMWVEDLSTLQEVPATADGMTERAESSVLARAFKSLPGRWQTVLWHRCVEQESASDVGSLLGMSPNAVAALAFRAREGLRQAYLAEHLAVAQDDTCRDTREMLPAYLRDDCGATKTARVAAHLDSCVECAAAASELDNIGSRMLGQMLAPTVLAMFGTSLLKDTVAVSPVLPLTSSSERVVRRGLWAKGVAATTAALTLAAALVILALSSRGDPQTPQSHGGVVAAESASASDLVERPAPVVAPDIEPETPREVQKQEAPKTIRPNTRPTVATKPSSGQDLSVRQSSFSVLTDESGARSNMMGIRIDSPTVAPSVTIAVKGLSAYQVRNGPNDLDATCTSAADGSGTGTGTDAVATITCRLAPGSGSLYLSVSVGAPTQLRVSIAATGNDDPVAANNAFTQAIT